MPVLYVCIILARKFAKQNDVYYVVPPVVTDWISQVCDDSLQRGKQHIPGEIMFCIFLPFIVFFWEGIYKKLYCILYIFYIFYITLSYKIFNYITHIYNKPWTLNHQQILYCVFDISHFKDMIRACRQTSTKPWWKLSRWQFCPPILQGNFSYPPILQGNFSRKSSKSITREMFLSHFQLLCLKELTKQKLGGNTLLQPLVSHLVQKKKTNLTCNILLESVKQFKTKNLCDTNVNLNKA